VNAFVKTGLTQAEIKEIRQSRRKEFTSGLSEDDTREYLAATGTVLPQGTDILSREAAFVNAFIKTGLTQAEIQEIRQSRHERFVRRRHTRILGGDRDRFASGYRPSKPGSGVCECLHQNRAYPGGNPGDS
jgi:hypothetical protein